MTHVSSLYLHVPFCKHLCNYCDFYKKLFESGSNQIEDFHQFLSKSWERQELLLRENAFEWSPLETIYLGGGTPSLWGQKGSHFLGGWFGDRLKRSHSCEFTMEIDPGTWNKEMIESWSQIGLNRISIGTQTLDPHFLKVMDRSHTLEETFELLSYCQHNNWNFSLDFLLGLPYSRENKRDIESELKTLLAFAPKHISLYILNARSRYPHAQAIPDDEFIREEYLFVSEFLRSLGFIHYEVSNFALPGYESKHNLKYWKGEAVAALGPTGTGYLPKSSESALRYKWKVMNAEIEVEPLGPQELQLENVYLSLRTYLGWKPKKMTPKLENVLNTWQQQGYGTFKEQRVILGPLGYLMLDSLMDDLFRSGF
jgi:oxygen-independent coproporphyrinogen-3 oxidase